MDILNVVLVLGKRLVNNSITAEGCSRVEALVNLLAKKELQQTVVIFCGGATEGQTVTEAQAMYDYFIRCSAHSVRRPCIFLLEDQSTNTIENLSNAAKKIIDSRLCETGQAVHLQLISNDYHLKRIFEIQALMDEQGLLRVLENQCAQTGLKIEIDRAIAAHCSVPYPHKTSVGRVFLLLDELTTYRVYLEGVVADVFQRPLLEVRRQPLQIAWNALEQLENDLSDADSRSVLEVIRRAVDITTPELDRAETLLQLEKLDSALTKLNRQFDPERHAC